MDPLVAALVLFGLFLALVFLRVPVAFALGLACVPVFMLDPRLTPFLCEQFHSHLATRSENSRRPTPQ